MKSKFVILAACLLSVAPAQMAPPNQQSPRTDCWTIAGEGCAGLAGGASLGIGGAVVGGTIALFTETFDATARGYVIMGVGAGAGILLGTTRKSGTLPQFQVRSASE